MIIEKGHRSDIDEIERFYNEVTDDLDAHINYPGWEKGIYPARQDAIAGIEEGNLYVARDEGRITGSFILSHKPEAAYAKTDWKNCLDYRFIFVIYTFAVHPQFQKKGIGKEMLRFIVEHGKQENMKAIRLDVYQKNLPAISLYKKMGFQYMDTVDLGYGEYGLDRFELYQKLL